jgi:biopolymer transport protein ExbD
MPVKLGSKLAAENEARIEIIPLIDIMFFLLAAFMLVSLSMVNLKAIKVNLPTAVQSTADSAKNLVTISVDKGGSVFLDQRPAANNELVLTLATWRKTNHTLRVFISADQDTRHGDIIRVLDLVRSAGIERVAFATRDPIAVQP